MPAANELCARFAAMFTLVASCFVARAIWWSLANVSAMLGMRLSVAKTIVSAMKSISSTPPIGLADGSTKTTQIAYATTQQKAPPKQKSTSDVMRQPSLRHSP